MQMWVQVLLNLFQQRLRELLVREHLLGSNSIESSNYVVPRPIHCLHDYVFIRPAEHDAQEYQAPGTNVRNIYITIKNAAIFDFTAWSYPPKT